MSTEDLEARLNAASSPEERHEIAVAAVGESLEEAKARAAKVAELEQARGDDEHPAITANATNTAALIDPILGMWMRR